jgi:hypothetical protein
MLLGVAFVLSTKLNKAYRLDDFTWKKFWKINLFSTVSAILAGLLLVINQGEVIAVFQKIAPSIPFLSGGLFAGICGIAGVIILQGFVDITSRHEKTVVGLNKKEEVIP